MANKGDDDRTGMKQVSLDEEERNARARAATALKLELDALDEKKASHNRQWNEELRQLDTRITQLSTEAETGKAWVPAQTDMFGGANDVDGVDADADAVDEDEAPKRRRRGGRRGLEAAGDAA